MTQNLKITQRSYLTKLLNSNPLVLNVPIDGEVTEGIIRLCVHRLCRFLEAIEDCSSTMIIVSKESYSLLLEYVDNVGVTSHYTPSISGITAIAGELPERKNLIGLAYTANGNIVEINALNGVNYYEYV